MAYIKNTAFEIYVSNSKRNDTQNITGKFGSFDDDVFIPDICSAGFLCKKHSLFPNEGYESPFVRDSVGSGPWGESNGLKNANSWYMVVAENGIDGFSGDHTGVYACDTHNVNSAHMGDIDVNLPGRTLGLPIREDERGNYVEMIVGEQYNFSSGNFATLPTASLPYCVIQNGLLVAQTTAPTDGSVYFELKEIGRFIEGAGDGGARYTLLCCRSINDGTGVSVIAGTYDDATGTWSNFATYSVTRNAESGEYVVTGEIPYGEADSIFPTAGYRFAVKVKNASISSKAQLPNGTICKTTNFNVPSGYNTYTKAAFEDDGSLITIFEPTAQNLSREREIQIKWDEDVGFETYTFDLSGATLQAVYSVTNSVTNGTASGDTQILGGETASVTIAPATGYVLPATISVVGATGAYDSTTGVVALSNPTDNVTITAICEAAASLVPFSVGQTISGIDFGNVQNGDTSSAMDSFLAGLTYTDGMAVLVGTGSDDTSILAAYLTEIAGESGFALLYGGETVLYATVAIEAITATQGFQGLTDGKYGFSNSLTVASVSAETGWNGTLIGAVEAQQSLTPFAIGNTVNQIKFDTSLSVSQVVEILESLSYVGAEVDGNSETIDLIVATGSLADNGVLKSSRITVGENAYEYAIIAFEDNTEEAEPIIVFSSAADAEQGVTEGFQNLADGSLSVTWEITQINQGSIWNTGMLVGE